MAALNDKEVASRSLERKLEEKDLSNSFGLRGTFVV